MKTQIATIKANQKILALEIRNLKSKRKELKGYVPNLVNAQITFRINHIAYCMLRGRTLEQIEPKLRDPNSFIHAHVRQQALAIIDSVLNPKPVEVKVEEKKETLWNKVTNFIS